MPTSVIDKPIFWIAFGLMEISLPMIIPNRRWAGVAMFMVACVFFAVAFDWLPSPQLPSTIPPLVWYAPSALIGAILLAVLSAFIQISQSRSSAQRIVAGLRDFGREWAGRFVGFPIGGYGIINAEQEAFNDQFKRELDQLNRELEARGITPADHEAVRVHKLRRTASLQEPLSAYEWATLIEELASLLSEPKRWMNKRLLDRTLIIGALFGLIWLAAFEVQHRYGGLGSSKTLATPMRPLADDALKWNLSDELRRDLAAGSSTKCQAVIVHHSNPYSDHFADDLGAVIEAAGGKVDPQVARQQLPDGIRLITPERGDQAACAGRVKQRIQMDLGRLFPPYSNIDSEPASALTPPLAAFGELGKCFEIDIGDQPGS